MQNPLNPYKNQNTKKQDNPVLVQDPFCIQYRLEPDQEQDYPVISLRFRVESCTLKNDVATQGPGQRAPGQGAPAQSNTPYLGYTRKIELRVVDN